MQHSLYFPVIRTRARKTISNRPYKLFPSNILGQKEREKGENRIIYKFLASHLLNEYKHYRDYDLSKVFFFLFTQVSKGKTIFFI